MTSSYEPVNPFLLGHGGGERQGRKPAAAPITTNRRLRGVKSHASLFRPIATLSEKLEDLYGLINPPPVEESLEKDVLGPSATVARKVDHMSLQNRLHSAKFYEEWEIAAQRLDDFEGHDLWKRQEESADYDVPVIKQRIRELERIRDSGDVKEMLMHVRTTLGRDIGGIGNPRLYRFSRIGTKELVERYIMTAVDLIQTTVRLTATSAYLPWSIERMRDMWLQTRQAFGRSALLLSGGGTLGMCHIGVVKALYEADALPRIISGTSAGSIVAAVCCAKTTEEVPGLLRDFCDGELDVFTKKGEEGQLYANMAKHFFTQGNLYDIGNLNRVMKIYLGDLTFLEAYNRTKKILNICVSNEDPREQLTVLNYVTAPNVLIWSAVAASCSVPLIYSPAKLYEKHPRTGELTESSQSWIDGSVGGDIPMERLSELFDVNHFIVSQVNPHVMPFIPKEDDVPVHEAQDQPASMKDTFYGMAKDELLFRLKMLTEMGIFPNASTRLKSILGQSYQGDINIHPQVPRANYLRVLLNPTPDFMLGACAAGEKATWPKINRIRSRCAIEHAIELAVKEACDHAEFSANKVHLRRSAYHKTMFDSQLRDSRVSSQNRENRSSTSAKHSQQGKSRAAGHRSTKSLHERGSVRWQGPEVDGANTEDTGESDDSSITSRDPDFSRDENEAIVSDTDLESPPSPPPSKWMGRRTAASQSQPTTPSLASKTFNLSPTEMPSLPSMTPIGGNKRSKSRTGETSYKRILEGGKRALSPIYSPRPKPVDASPPITRRNSKFALNMMLMSSAATKAKGANKGKSSKSRGE